MTNKCYTCKYRGTIAGDCHSKCNHPVASNPAYAIMALMQIPSGRVVVGDSKEIIEIEGNKHGIEEGWFTWPLNFDPVWLEKCSGYLEK